MQKLIFFTPGPSQLYPTVEQHINNAFAEDILSISHRSERFHEIYKSAIDNIRLLLGVPQDFSIFFLSSATEAMERIIQNTVEIKSFHFVNGSFSKKFCDIGLNLKKNASSNNIELGEWCDIKKIQISPTTELIALTQNETSTGVSIPINEIEYLAKRYPKVLIAVDIVSSVPYVNLPFNLLDCVFFSVQKGFGMPSGLGVLIISPRAYEKSVFLNKKGLSTGSYHSFASLSKQNKIFQTPETPNVLSIYLLDKISKDMLNTGIQQIRKNTEEKSNLLYDFFEKQENLSLFVKNAKLRSKTTIVVSTLNGSKSIIESIKTKGFILGSGYGSMKEKQIRIANFPAHQKTDFTMLLNHLLHLSN